MSQRSQSDETVGNFSKTLNTKKALSVYIDMTDIDRYWVSRTWSLQSYSSSKCQYKVSIQSKSKNSSTIVSPFFLPKIVHHDIDFRLSPL